MLDRYLYAVGTAKAYDYKGFWGHDWGMAGATATAGPDTTGTDRYRYRSCVLGAVTRHELYVTVIRYNSELSKNVRSRLTWLVQLLETPSPKGRGRARAVSCKCNLGHTQ